VTARPHLFVTAREENQFSTELLDPNGCRFDSIADSQFPTVLIGLNKCGRGWRRFPRPIERHEGDGLSFKIPNRYWDKGRGNYCSPENRSHADCRVILKDAPMAAHVAPSTLALFTKRERLFSTCAPAAAIRGRLARTPSRSRSSSQDVSPVGKEGGLPMIWLHRSTHSLQM
jgi:hypothetical protein